MTNLCPIKYIACKYGILLLCFFFFFVSWYCLLNCYFGKTHVCHAVANKLIILLLQTDLVLGRWVVVRGMGGGGGHSLGIWVGGYRGRSCMIPHVDKFVVAALGAGIWNIAGMCILTTTHSLYVYITDPGYTV